MTGRNILKKIAEKRRERVRVQGHALGASLPARRQAPLVPFGKGAEPFLVCEIKRCSPSQGEISAGLDAVELASRYHRQGVRNLSVLTEEDHFHGSLEDLLAVKRRFPGLAVLRKDFLLDEEDLETSYRAGADAVLLIAALLDPTTLARLHRRALALGLAALVEVHDRAELEMVGKLRPSLIGINSRSLVTFELDRLAPLAVRRKIDWKTTAVFESGIKGAEDILVGRAAGFQGFLVGEAVVRRPEAAGELASALRNPLTGNDFWGRLALRRRQASNPSPGGPARPLVKVCGLTRRRDAELAAELGADLLGFVFAPSPRRAGVPLLRELRGLKVLKVAVVAPRRNGPGRMGAAAPQGEVLDLLEQGLVDAIQLHGEEEPEECLNLAFPYYKAVRLRDSSDAVEAGRFRCPRVLADAWSAKIRGGTGQRVPEPVVEEMRRRGPLWLAGGIGPDNVAGLIRRFSPELIDASSRLESEPGAKDRDLLKDFFHRIAAAGQEVRG